MGEKPEQDSGAETEKPQEKPDIPDKATPLNDDLRQRISEFEHTEHEHMEQVEALINENSRLIKEKQKLYSILNALPSVVISFNRKGTPEFVNKTFEKMYGWTCEELLLGKVDFVPEEEKELLWKGINAIYKEGKPEFCSKTRRYTKEGKLKHVEVLGKRYVDEKNNIDGTLSIHTDVDHIHELEIENIKNQQIYKAIIESSPQGVAVYDINGKLIYLNSSFTRIFGWDLSDYNKEGKLENFVPEEEWETTKKYIQMIIEGKSFTDYRTTRLTKSGNKIPVNLCGAVFKDQEGRSMGSVITLQDLREQHKTEQLLNLKDERYRSIVDNIATGVFQITLEGDFITVNSSFARIFEYSSSDEAIAGMKNMKNIFPQNIRQYEVLINTVHEKGYAENLELQVVGRNNRLIPATLKLYNVSDSENNIICYQGIIEDLSLKREMEQKKYLIFSQDGNKYGIELRRVKEIVNNVPLHMPEQLPGHIKGIACIRDRFIAVVDTECMISNGKGEANDKNCIIIVENGKEDGGFAGILVEAVLGVSKINVADIEDFSVMGDFQGINNIISGFAKSDDGIKLIVDLDNLLTGDDFTF